MQLWAPIFNNHCREGLSENLSKDASNPVTLVERCRSNSDFTGYETWDSGFGSASAEVAEWTKFSKPLIGKSFATSYSKPLMLHTLITCCINNLSSQV